MLQEFALEPALLNNWHDFRFFISQFGIDKGRLISRFPKKWKRMVYQSLSNCKEIERKRIEERLTRIDARMLPRPPRNWNEDHDWLTNAEREHDVIPFRAILARANPRNCPSVICGDEVDDTVDYRSLPETDSRRLWQANTAAIIRRDAAEMADVIDPFLRRANTILFVDKHFGPENPRHRIPLEEFASRLDERFPSAMPEVLAIHCACKSALEFFRSQCEKHLAAMFPSNQPVQCCRWAPEDMHNRFVLTELGGVAFLEGLDQFMGDGRSQDVVCLLSEEVSCQLIEQYTPGTSPFTKRDECVIRGSRRI